VEKLYVTNYLWKRQNWSGTLERPLWCVNCTRDRSFEGWGGSSVMEVMKYNLDIVVMQEAYFHGFSIVNTVYKYESLQFLLSHNQGKWEINTKLWLGNLEGRDHLKDLGVDRRISKWVLKELECKILAWIHLAQDRHQWRALVNTEMNLRVPEKAGNLLTCWVSTNTPSV